MDIIIDFDGTCVTHEFPEVGKDIGAVSVLKELIKSGHNLILFTMRSDNGERDYLSEAVFWFKANGINLYGIQVNPTQGFWTNSPKAYGELIIDDAAIGSPLSYILNGELQERGFINWVKLRRLLVSKGILKNKK